MQSTPLKVLFALVLATVVVGCASKKTKDTTAVVTPPPVVETTPVVEPAVVEGSDLAPWAAGDGVMGWQGFESNSANYSGDTRTRVIYFGFDQSAIPSAAYASLKAHAKHLAAKPAARLTVEGHADERGTPEYNIALAERRAQTVVNFLVLNGAKKAQLDVVSFGEEKPAELGHDEMAWAKNRRAVLSYTAGQP